jgi:hypothetical protein
LAQGLDRVLLEGANDICASELVAVRLWLGCCTARLRSCTFRRGYQRMMDASFL